MADPEVKLKFAGSSADAERAIAILERRLSQIENGVKQSSKRMRDAAKDSSDAWAEMGRGAEDFLGSLSGMRSPLDVVVRGVQTLKAEWDDLVNRQDRAADANRDFARNLQAAANNSDAPLADIKARMLEITQAASVTPQQAAKLLNIGQAAKGTLGDQSVDATIVAAAKIARLDPGAMEGLVNTSLDLQKQIDGTTPEQAIGFTLAAMAKTRVPDTEKFTKNVLPGIIGVNKLDNTSIEFATALSAGITQAAGDTEGRKSRTAMTALALQLRDAFPELKDTEARVRALQESPELRKAFLQGGEINGRKLAKMKFDVTGPDGQVLQLDTDRASFERQMVPAMEQVLTKGTFASNMLEESLRSVPSLQTSDKEFQRRFMEQEGDATLNLANKQLGGEVKTELAKVLDLKGADQSVNRNLVDARLQANGFGLFQRTMMMGDAAVNGFLGGDYNASLQARLETEKSYLAGLNYTGLGTKPEENEKMISVLDEILRELKQQAKPPVQVNRDGGKDDR